MRKTLRVVLVAAALAAVGIAGTAGAARFITGRDIKNGSIGLVDLSRAARHALQGRTGPAGPAGPQGAQGPQGTPGTTGPAGAPGPSSLSTTIRTQSFEGLPESFAEGEVRCPDGMVAIGGSVSPGALIPVYDAPSEDGRGWEGAAYNSSTTTTFRMLVTVICTPGDASVVASAGTAASHPGEKALKAAERAALSRR